MALDPVEARTLRKGAGRQRGPGPTWLVNGSGAVFEGLVVTCATSTRAPEPAVLPPRAFNTFAREFSPPRPRGGRVEGVKIGVASR